MKVRALVIFSMLLALSACGGGSGGSTFTGNSPVSLLLTDAFSDQYAKVWVTVLQVTAQDASGQTVTLYDNPVGNVVNLTELNGVATLLNTQNLPAGSYSNFQVSLADAVALVDKTTGQSIAAAFSGTGQPQTVAVTGQISIGTGSNATIAIDFDLQQFSYDPTTGLVTPVLVLRQNPAQIARTVADIDGTVARIVDGTHFQLRASHGQGLIDVSLQSSATVFNTADGSVSNDTSALQAGQRVSVYGNYDPALMTVDATRVEIQTPMASTTPQATNNAKVEGVVSSFDSNSGLLSLDVREASFIPAGATLDIDLTASNPVFVKGSLDILTAGQRVEIRGNWQDPVFTPTTVEIEGGLPQFSDQANGQETDGNEVDSNENANDRGTDSGAMDNSRDRGMGSAQAMAVTDAYVEVKGEVQSLTNQGLTLTVLEVDAESSATQQLGQRLDVDLANAFFKRGDAGCLQAGDRLELKGAIHTDGIMDARVVDVERGCGLSPATPAIPAGMGSGTASNSLDTVVSMM